MDKSPDMNLLLSYSDLWSSTARSLEELQTIMRIIVERAFIAAVTPSPKQIAEWKAAGVRSNGLSAHIVVTTGKIVTAQTVEQLWRLFSNHPEPRRARTIADFLIGLPESLKCQHCKDTKGPFHVDHCIALKKGGLDAITNLQLLCVTCNLKKGSKLDPNKIYLEFEN